MTNIPIGHLEALAIQDCWKLVTDGHDHLGHVYRDGWLDQTLFCLTYVGGQWSLTIGA